MLFRCVCVLFLFCFLFAFCYSLRADMILCGMGCDSDQLDWLGVVFLADWGRWYYIFFFLLPLWFG